MQPDLIIVLTPLLNDDLRLSSAADVGLIKRHVQTLLMRSKVWVVGYEPRAVVQTKTRGAPWTVINGDSTSIICAE